MSKTDGLVNQARHWSHSAMEEGHENEGYLLARFADTIEQQSAALAQAEEIANQVPKLAAALTAEQEAKRVMATELREARDEIWKLEEAYEIRMRDSDDTEAKLAASEAARERLREFADWVESWVHNPVGSYSVSALDGLFGMTRDKIAALASPPAQAGASEAALPLQVTGDGWQEFPLPKSLHWLGDRESAEATQHALDMTGCVMYFDRQSDCLAFMRWLEHRTEPAPARDAVLEEERKVIAGKAREYAGHYPPHSDGRNTFILLAEWIEARAAHNAS